MPKLSTNHRRYKSFPNPVDDTALWFSLGKPKEEPPKGPKRVAS